MNSPKYFVATVCKFRDSNHSYGNDNFSHEYEGVIPEIGLTNWLLQNAPVDAKNHRSCESYITHPFRLQARVFQAFNAPDDGLLEVIGPPGGDAEKSLSELTNGEKNEAFSYPLNYLSHLGLVGNRLLLFYSLVYLSRFVETYPSMFEKDVRYTRNSAGETENENTIPVVVLDAEYGYDDEIFGRNKLLIERILKLEPVTVKEFLKELARSTPARRRTIYIEDVEARQMGRDRTKELWLSLPAYVQNLYDESYTGITAGCMA